jgi:hypothetical protein
MRAKQASRRAREDVSPINRFLAAFSRRLRKKPRLAALHGRKFGGAAKIASSLF